MVTFFNIIPSIHVIQYNYDGHNRYLFSGYYCVKCFLSMMSFHLHNPYYSHFTDEEIKVQ